MEDENAETNPFMIPLSLLLFYNAGVGVGDDDNKDGRYEHHVKTTPLVLLSLLLLLLLLLFIEDDEGSIVRGNKCISQCVALRRRRVGEMFYL